jgi:LmbE family N-acetylglucosaminyl deacetylase
VSKRVLVVAAHPDDEVLGMGGTMARHRANGDLVSVLFLADGVGSRPNADGEHREKRREAARQACQILGARIHGFETFPDNAFDGVPTLSIIKAIEQAKQAIEPDLIYTHHGGDLNVDHRITARAVMTAFRPQPHETYTEICAFEIGSSTEWSHSALASGFNPDCFVDITAFLETKLQAYRCYTEEVRQDPHVRSLESVKITACYRGRQVGVHAAEAFVTLKRIRR